MFLIGRGDLAPSEPSQSGVIITRQLPATPVLRVLQSRQWGWAEGPRLGQQTAEPGAQDFVLDCFSTKFY